MTVVVAMFDVEGRSYEITISTSIETGDRAVEGFVKAPPAWAKKLLPLITSSLVGAVTELDAMTAVGIVGQASMDVEERTVTEDVARRLRSV